MALKISSSKLSQYGMFVKSEQLWLYNGLDCTITHSIFNAMSSDLDLSSNYRETYDFERRMSAVAMTMMLRGVALDHEFIRNKIAELRPRLVALGGMDKVNDKWTIVKEDALLQKIAVTVTGKTINYQSTPQLRNLIYDELSIEPVRVNEKGKWKISLNEDTLLNLRDWYPRARVIVNILLYLRGMTKLIEVLEKKLDEDGRIRCSYNVSGTETGRWSSSSTVFGTGSNLQNITEELREGFVPDKGKILFNADLEQAESRGVAYLSGDEAYIEACESQDLHTTVASMVFNIPAERKVVDQKYFRHFTYRDMAKRAGHGLNYGLTPASLARHMKIPEAEAWRVYLQYLGGELPIEQADRYGLLNLAHTIEDEIVKFPGAFPGIRMWHETTRVELETQGILVTPLNRERAFWDRLDSPQTFRKAIAYRPQSLIGDVLNRGLLKIWQLHEPRIELLGQVHDSVLGQFDEKFVDELAPAVLECLRVPVKIGGRTLVIPSEIAIGYNWGKRVELEDGTILNPRGLQKWAPNQEITWETTKTAEYSHATSKNTGTGAGIIL